MCICKSHLTFDWHSINIFNTSDRMHVHADHEDLNCFILDYRKAAKHKQASKAKLFTSSI